MRSRRFKGSARQRAVFLPTLQDIRDVARYGTCSSVWQSWLAGKVTSNKRCFQTTLASMSLSNCSLASSACPKTYTSKSNGNWLDATGRPIDSRFHDVGTNPESMLGNGFMQMHNWVCNSPAQV